MYCLTKFCLLCLNADNKLLNINSYDSDGETFSRKLKYCINFMYIPNITNIKICLICCDILRSSYLFKKRCLENNIIFKHYIEQLNEKSNVYGELSLILYDFDNNNSNERCQQKNGGDINIKEKCEYIMTRNKDVLRRTSRKRQSFFKLKRPNKNKNTKNKLISASQCFPNEKFEILQNNTENVFSLSLPNNLEDNEYDRRNLMCDENNLVDVKLSDRNLDDTVQNNINFEENASSCPQINNSDEESVDFLKENIFSDEEKLHFKELRKNIQSTLNVDVFPILNYEFIKSDNNEDDDIVITIMANNNEEDNSVEKNKEVIDFEAIENLSQSNSSDLLHEQVPESKNNLSSKCQTDNRYPKRNNKFLIKHLNGRLSCPICTKSFNYTYSLEKHISIHTKSSTKSNSVSGDGCNRKCKSQCRLKIPKTKYVWCPVCDIKCSGSRGMKIHFARAHNELFK